MLSLLKRKFFMIQRIQTIYFSLAALVLVYFSVGAPIISFYGNDISYLLKSNELIATTSGNPVAETSVKYYFIGAIVLTLWVIYVIISFRNLKKQLSAARIGSFMYAAYLMIIVLSYFIGESLTENPTVSEKSAQFELGVYLLAVGYIFYLFGIRGIKKDKKLIDSVDRIR